MQQFVAVDPNAVHMQPQITGQVPMRTAMAGSPIGSVSSAASPTARIGGSPVLNHTGSPINTIPIAKRVNKQKQIIVTTPPPDAAVDVDDNDIANMPPSSHRPCIHNDWDDVRTRKGSKILRCRVCQRKWKLPSSSVPRCIHFLRSHCPNETCQLLHVHKKKEGLEDRFKQFGSAVLDAMPPAAKQAAECVMKGRVPISPESRRRVSISDAFDFVSSNGCGSYGRRGSASSDHPSLMSDEQRRGSTATSVSEPPSLLSAENQRRLSLAAFSEHDRRTSTFSTDGMMFDGGLPLPAVFDNRRCSNVSELEPATRAAIVADLQTLKCGPDGVDGQFSSYRLGMQEEDSVGGIRSRRSSNGNVSPHQLYEGDGVMQIEAGIIIQHDQLSPKMSSGANSRKSSLGGALAFPVPQVPQQQPQQPQTGSRSISPVNNANGLPPKPKENDAVHALSEHEVDAMLVALENKKRKK